MEKSKEVPSGKLSHTPTPWHLRNESTCIAYTDGTLVSYLAQTSPATTCPEHGSAEANAAFIVRAVNAYETLLDIAKRYRSRLIAEGPKANAALIKEIDTALAKVEGK